MIQLPALAATVASKLERKEIQNNPFPFPSIVSGRFLPPCLGSNFENLSHQSLLICQVETARKGNRGRGTEAKQATLALLQCLAGRGNNVLLDAWPR